ncbi:MAG: S8 family serine peptidase [Promethearchaeota archaeon]
MKLEYILVVGLVLASFSLCFINYLDSNLKENRTTPITSLETIGINISEESMIDLQSNIVSWGEVLANNPNLSNLDNIISYQESALVKVREDNKIEFIVKRDTMEFSSQTLDLLSKYNVEFNEEDSYFNASIVYISLENIESFIPESKSTPGIAYVEPNFYNQLDFVPNDEYYASDLWALPLIGMESAWDHELGSHDILVAVVDTGIDYTHPDLSTNYLPLGYDWVNEDENPMDDHMHGTHCAGTIAGIINNMEGVAGMANVSIFAEKAFNFLGWSSSSFTRSALMHAVDMGADIISCSWGGSSYSETLYEAIEYAINHNVMVIAAAGNDDSNELHYPAAYPGVIAVSATDQNDLKASFSNYGDWVDISAPGVDILSTVPYDVKDYYYGFASGTSMATPHVSGLAALVKSAFPTSNASQIETLIYDSALDLGDPGFDIYYGHGRIDATNIFGPDTTPPSYTNLVESADPLILGLTEVISIDVSDPSGVNQVIIEFEGSNHSMTNIGGNTWQYDAWKPSNIGIYPYTIYMEDNINLWNSISESIEVREDTEPPDYSDLDESSDPLELGNTEIISISITDLSGINQVLIELEGVNYTMSNIGGDTWQYDSWTPSNTGIYPYTIYMEDYYDHWNSVSDSIRVVDTTLPTYQILTNNTTPLELGNSRTIMVKATDKSGINQVLIEYEGLSDYMTDLGGDVWQYKNFIPTNIGTCNYTIYIQDKNNNWAFITDDIEVRDTIAPYAPTLIDYPSGELSGKITFNWEDGYDPSGILYYKLIIDNESYPLITPGNIFEIEIENVGSESSYYELEEILPLGTYYFFLYQIDEVGLQSPYTTGMFTVISPKNEIENVPGIELPPLLWLVIIIGAIVAIPSFVVSKKIKSGKSKILDNTFELKYLKSEIKDLIIKKKQTEKAAERAVKYGNYEKAAELYEECEILANQLFKKGTITEAESAKYYANMKSKAFKVGERRVSFITFSINELLTKYCDSIRVKYYSDPQIYSNGQKILNGWLLNDTKFLQHRLTNPQNGLELVRELGLYPESLSEITAIQLVYINDLSYNSINDICQEHQNPSIITLVIGINWPSTFQGRHSFSPPEDINITHKENIRIIDCNLFASFIGFEGEYRDHFFKAIKSYMRSKP